MNVQDRIDNAVPALGYTLVPLRYRGVKVNVFDPNQPRGEDGKWTDGATLARDKAYAAAVLSGDTETARRLVEEAAHRAGFTIGPVYHGTMAKEITEFNPAKTGGANGVSRFGEGFYFSEVESVATFYTKGAADSRVYNCYLRLDNPLVVSSKLEFREVAQPNLTDPRSPVLTYGQTLIAKGYDGVIYNFNGKKNEIVVFDPTAIKLADTVTRDSQGAVIPLSKRFDTRSKLITNEQDEEGNEGRWVTMSGTPVFIKDGEDAGTAAARTFKNKPSTEEAPKKEGALKKWLREKTAPLREAFEQGRAGAKPSPMQKAIPVTSKPAAVSGKIQRIREVGLGAKETVAELFYKRHVDEVFSGKVTAADKVDALMKKGVIKTGSEKPDVVRERAIRDFDKAVILREQAAADRTESGEGKRAYTDKTLRAGLQKGETLAERYFPGHVDDLYNGTTSVTAKVDSMIEGGELGFGRGDKGFLKMRETAIKDFTRALNLREASDVKEEKRKLEDAKPKKLTKREQQAEWSPSEDEVLASGPVVSSGTGWKRNMAENQPRDEDGKWTKDGGAVGVSFTATRFRPVERISFDRPLVGPSGAKLTGYEWKWQPQDYVDDRGEDRVRRVSDWGAAETSADTGRDIVHQFIVQMSNGEARTVSAESVPVLLGFSERGKVAGLPTLVSATKTLAQLKMKLAIAQARVDENNRISKHVETVTPPFEQLQILKGDVSAFGRVYNEEYAHTFILPSPRGNGETVRERQSRSSTERLDTGVLLGRTREILVDKWRAALAETMGYAYVSDYTDLKRRAERQEHKVQQLTSSPKANAFDPNQPRDEDGKWTSIGPVYHGTRREFTEFDNTAQPVHRIGNAAAQPSFIYFSGEEQTAVSYAYRGKEGRPRIITAMLNMKNPLDITDSIRKQRKKGVPFGKAKQEALSQLTDAHDGFIYRGDMYNAAEYAVRSPQQITTVPKVNEFDPNQPRDKDGKWTGGTLSFKGEPEKVGAFTKDVAIRRSTVTGPDGKPVMTWHNPDGSQVTDEKVLARIEEAKGTALFIPGYKGAWLNPDVTSDLIGFGFDQADRAQYVYTKEHAERSNAKTFKIVDEMRTKIDGMRAGAAKDRKAGVAAAFLFKLEDMTCIRVGSDNDTKAKKQAYGLTTLRGEHVKVEGSVVRLDFTAKGGHPVSYKIKDRELATFITARKEQNGDGPLWPDVSNSKFNAYLKSLEPGAEITAHKFRHYHATRLAEGVVAQYEGKTISAKEFKAVQREACEAAAAHLANTWSICREEYVNPTVWGRLTVKAALKGNMAENQPRDEDGKWTDGGGGWSWRNNKSSPAEAFAASLSQEERDRIQNYYTAGTDEVNYPLREGRQLKGELEVTSKLLDKCFYDAPPLPKPITLYRVIPMAAATNWMEGADERGNIRDAAYVSTTASEGAISRIQEDLDEETFVFEIKVPAGAKVLPLAELSGGHFGWQEEYLLPRNSKFHDNGDGTLSLVTVRRDGRLSTSV